jgi:DNA-binding response OmpR family regulator
LILLDLMLPKLDGISFCKKLRQEGDRTPILLLTAHDTSTNKVMGLDAGADDYVAKPFDLHELLARIRALLRRGSSTISPVMSGETCILTPVTVRSLTTDNSCILQQKSILSWSFSYATLSEYSAKVR